MVGWLFALLSYHSWVLFSSLTVTYVLYLNKPSWGESRLRILRILYKAVDFSLHIAAILLPVPRKKEEKVKCVKE